MAFSRSYPRTREGSSYPKWEEIFLTEEEEWEEEKRTKDENISLMRECIHDAQELFKEMKLKDIQTDVIRVAISLFEKRASHQVYNKERRSKEKFDSGESDENEK